MNKIEALALRAAWPHRADTPAPLGLRGGLRRWLLRTRHHDSVRELDPRQRRDVGLDSDAWGRESAEPFWRG
jgi:uncharacterized protein YjiS (DUF1127 family)